MRKIAIVLPLIVVISAAAAIGAESERRTYLVGAPSPSFQSLEGTSIQVVGRFTSVDAFVVELTEEDAARLTRSGSIRYLEPLVPRRASDLRTRRADRFPVSADGEAEAIVAQASTQTTPFGITMVGAPLVWRYGRGASVKVAVIDTGIDPNHPDLRDVYRGGFDFVNNDPEPDDENGHGTHVAGTIAAMNNDFGVVGVAPEVELFALKVLDAEGNGTNLTLSRAVDWAIANGMHVINMSLGGGEMSLTERDLFQRARDAGILAVAASGNAYDSMQRDGIDYPANYDSVVSVGAVNSNKLVASFSQRGSNLDFVAPGVGVNSTYYRGDAYSVRVGTDAFVGIPMEYSPATSSVTGNVVFCGLGNTMADFPSSVAGQVALIERGEITFKEKTINAKNAGAIAVIIFNSQPGTFSGTLCTAGANEPCTGSALPTDPVLTLSMSREEGLALKGMEGATASVDSGGISFYGMLQGTSMATPHVAGVAALLRSLDPGASVQQVVETMRLAAEDLGEPGRDNVYGYGLVSAYPAARMLAPQKFVPDPYTRQRSTRRPGGL